MPTKPASKGLIALLRLPYWLMTGGLSLLTAFAITGALGKTLPNIITLVLIFFSMAFITSAGFALNDYYDRESDAIIKPKRPIPSGALSLRIAISISGALFASGLVLSLLINWPSFIILLIDSMVLVIYSAFIKRWSGFVANITVGLLVGTSFLYGEATVFGTVSLVSLSLYPICLGTVGGNLLRDILSSEGDSKVGYPTLPQKIGIRGTMSAAAVFFAATAILAPLSYMLGYFGVYFVILILLWGLILVFGSIRLLTSSANLQNVKRYERMITMSMLLLILALIAEALT
ncbi:MAG TPA: UbiA family prenyltransferase [Candidatus Sulfotelmatobacter sp.]|nr:UbiA family prenyltransferase [Candidatus Sulfotelmatobacter sp.]